MGTTIDANGERVVLSDAEWGLLSEAIIADTLRFWDGVAREVDAGLLPPELAGAVQTIDRATLHSLRMKLEKIVRF